MAKPQEEQWANCSSKDIFRKILMFPTFMSGTLKKRKKDDSLVYVALLRGINVGGKNKIDMKQLQKTFENAGMQSVTTYINSGNIIFTTNIRTKKQIETILKESIAIDFGLDIKVLLRDINEFSTIIDNLPDKWKNDKETKCDVLFLWEEIDNQTILEKIIVRPNIDTVIYAPGAVLWAAEQKNVTKSGLMKLPGTELYKKMTIRNVNTVRKIYELMFALR